MIRIAAHLPSRYKIVAATILIPTLVLAYSAGPPERHTSAPGEDDCTRCHASFGVNSGSGTFSIGAPTSFNPGDTLIVSVNLSQILQQRWGFEVTALNSSNQPVGHFQITDPARTQLKIDTSGRQYVLHTTAGTDNGTANAAPGWTFNWVAPTSPVGLVTFWGAGNAADALGSPAGDWIYTASTSLEGTCPVLTTGDVDLSESISAADIIALVGYVFKGGEIPLPCEGAGDVNCDSKVSSADIIYMVNYVFKSSIAPCDVCQLIPKSWPCQ